MDIEDAVGKIGPERKIVCLCGSTRFIDEFHKQTAIETLAGNIVLSIGLYVREINGIELPPDHAGEALGAILGKDVKDDLDLLHLDKVALAHEVLVLNVGGYIGKSTAREIRHAQALHKVIRYLEPPGMSTGA